MSTGLFLDPYQIYECEWGLFLDLSALALHKCKREVWVFLLLTDVLYNSSIHEHSQCAFLFPSLHSIPWKSFWNSCLWDTAVGLKAGRIQTHSGLHPQGESVWEAHSCVPGRCWYRASGPECQVYPYLLWECTCEQGLSGKWSSKYSSSFPPEISFFFVSHYLKWSFSAFRF